MIVGGALDEVDRARDDDEVLGVVVDDQVDDALEAAGHGEQPDEAVRRDDGRLLGHGEQQRLDLLRVRAQGSGFGFRVQGSGFGFGFKVRLRVRVRVQGSG
jgi:hypothetical protein